MAQVIWSPRAEKRLDEIGDYIAKDAPKRAADFVEKLLHSTRRLKEFPESGAVVPENKAFRQVVIQGYRLIYRVYGELAEVVTIISPGQSFDLEWQAKLLSVKAPMPDALTGWAWENALGQFKARDQRPALSPDVSPSATLEKLRVDPLESWLERFLSVHLDEFIKRKEQGPTAPKPKFTKSGLRELKEEIYKPTDGEDVYRFVGFLRNVRRVQQPTFAHLDEEWFHEYEAHLRRQFTRGPHMAEQKIARARKVYAAFHAWLKQQGHLWG